MGVTSAGGMIHYVVEQDITERVPTGMSSGRNLTMLPRPLARRNLLAAFILLCGLTIYIPSLDSYFLSDDFVLLSWTQIGSIGDLLGFFDPNTAWFYRPGVKIFYWLGQSIFGFHAAPLHLCSLVLHGANSYLVYRLAHKLTGSNWPAALSAGLLFLINAHHAETVSWIAAIGDLMGTFCMLSSLLLFQSFVMSDKYRYLIASVALFVIGLLTRETVTLLPFLALMWLLVFMREIRVEIRRAFGSLGAFFALLIGYLILQGMGRNGEQITTRGGLQFHLLNLDSILLGVMDYIHRLIPGGNMLAALPLETIRNIVWVEGALLSLLALLLWKAQWRDLLFGLLWLITTPLIFVFFSGPTDRYFYLPSIGYAILLGGALARLPAVVAKQQVPALNTMSKVVAVLVLAILLVTEGTHLSSRVLTWKSAGEVSGGVLYDIHQGVPEPNDYSAFYFVDVPLWLDDVPIFQNGLQEAVQISYSNRTLAATPISCDALQREVALPRNSLYFRYKANGAEQFFDRQECRAAYQSY